MGENRVLNVLGLAAAIVLTAGFAVSANAAENEFHGQFRINYYALSQDDTAGDSTSAARLRWRPTWDVALEDDIRMHMQLNIGHIRENTSNARYDNGGDPAVSIRHAVLDFPVPEIGGRINAGLVPLSDRFGDTLFSGDWDFNPLAFVWLGDAGRMDIRLATGKLDEGNEDDVDDRAIHMLDMDGKDWGISFYRYDDKGAQIEQNYAGVRVSKDFGGIASRAFFIYNDGTNDSTNVDNSGFAAKLEATTERFGIMALYASGDDGTGGNDLDSFITPMSLIGHTGYWGYTGKLNVQGPTDTGIDAPLNIDGAVYSPGTSGRGRGIITVQAKANFPITDKIAGYAAIGHYRHAESATAKDEEIGNDIYVQGKYEIRKNLNLEAGADYAMLSDNNEAYNYTSDNDVLLLFARLQLEY